MKSTHQISLASLCLLLVACVTVNVYFPAAAAEKAADRFIRDVYGEPPGKSPQQPQQQAPDSSQPEPQSLNEQPARILGWLLEGLVPTAEAASPDISISSPGINRLKAAMKSRNRALQPFYSNGAVGMTANGLLTLLNPKAVGLKDRNRVKQLIAAENRDRNALYAEVANANGHPEWQREIRATFASRWVGNAPRGWWYQDGRGNWKQK